MNVGFFYFDKFANHEVIIAHHELRKQNIISLAINKGIYSSTENQKIAVEYSLAEIDPRNIDILVIPGGFTDEMVKNEILKEYLIELDKLKKNNSRYLRWYFYFGLKRNIEKQGMYRAFHQIQ